MAQETTYEIWDQIANAWKRLRGEVRKQWGKLTDDDMEQIKGHRDVLALKLQQHYGLTRDEAYRQIDEWGLTLKF